MIDFLVENSPVIGTVGFFVGFCYVGWVALRRKNKKRFEDYSRIPMEDE